MATSLIWPRFGGVVPLVTLFGARSIFPVLRAVLVLAVASTAGVENFARFAGALVLVETMRLVYDFGLDTVAVRLMSRPGGVWRRSLVSLGQTKLILWWVAIVINFGILKWVVFPDALGSSLTLAMLGAAPMLLNLSLVTLQARSWIGVWFIPIVALAVGALALVWFALRHFPIEQAFLWYCVLEYVILAAFLGMTCLSVRHEWRGWHRMGCRFSIRRCLPYLRRGWVVCSGQLSALAYGKFDVVLVTVFAASAVASSYLFVQRIYEVSLFFVGGIASVMFSHLVKMGDPGNRSWRRSLVRWGAVFGMAGALVVLMFWVVLPLSWTFVTKMPVSAAALLWPFGAIALLALLNQFVTAVLNSLGKFRSLRSINFLNLLMILVAGSMAFFHGGPVSLLMAVAAVYLVSLVLQTRVLRQTLKG